MRSHHVRHPVMVRSGDEHRQVLDDAGQRRTPPYGKGLRAAAGNASRGRLNQTSALRGFTLIEVLVVIVVIAILATFVAPSIFQNVGDARVATAKTQIEALGTALDTYRLDNGNYPSTGAGLRALRERPAVDAPTNWRGPYLRKDVPMDPWGRAYVYVAPGRVNPQAYDLLSYGADGAAGGTGDNADIMSWK